MPAVAGAEGLGTNAYYISTAALACHPGANVVEGSYGSWVANGSPGHVVCDTGLVTPYVSQAGNRYGTIYVNGPASARICGSNSYGTVGGCYSAYDSYTTTGNHILAAPAQPLPQDTGWVQRYVAVFLDSGTSRVSVLK